jgi:hypothetical protein
LPKLTLTYIAANSEENFNQNIKKFKNDNKFLINDYLENHEKKCRVDYDNLSIHLPVGKSLIQHIAKKILNIGDL